MPRLHAKTCHHVTAELTEVATAAAAATATATTAIAANVAASSVFFFFPSLRMYIYACANDVASRYCRIAFIAWLVVCTGWIGLIWFGLLLIFTFYRCWLLVIWVRRSQRFYIVFFGVPTSIHSWCLTRLWNADRW